MPVGFQKVYTADHESAQSCVQDQAQVLLAGSAAVRAILSALKARQTDEAAAVAVEVAKILLEVCQQPSHHHLAALHCSACPCY